jgi:hypothetical protein
VKGEKENGMRREHRASDAGTRPEDGNPLLRTLARFAPM